MPRLAAPNLRDKYILKKNPSKRSKNVNADKVNMDFTIVFML